MPHPEVRNRTSFAYESLLVSDEEAVPQFVSLVQGCYGISKEGRAVLLDEQPAPVIGGEWYGDPASSSMRLEPQIAFWKPGTDVVMLGYAHAPGGAASRMQVGIRVGPMQKLVNVIGPRRLLGSAAGFRITEPEPFESIPLRYEHAFGGWDRRAEDPGRHRCEGRNPVGVGFRDLSYDTDDEVILPNIESPDHPFRSYGETPPPTGFGFIAANWQPRLAYAGTFDVAWDRSRKPLLPADFDRRFYNSASAGLVAPGHLRGDESVIVVGAAPEGRVTFNLPGEAAPVCLVEMRGRNLVELQTVMDTVIVDMEQRTLTLQWRAHFPVRNGMDDILAIEAVSGAAH